ncbi:hypothetical protein QQ045_023491 [Rhodiola kirilowii]
MTIYGDGPLIMKFCLCRYLKELGYRKSIILERCLITKPTLQWATRGNVRDIGVFLMRHMETYMGLKGKTTWKTQLGFEGQLLDRQIIKLRRLFALKILTSPVNRLTDSVIAKATKFAGMGEHEK